MKNKLALAAIAVALVILGATAQAGAWGIKGHTLVGVVATANLPAELPAFVRAQDSKNEIVYLQAEEDRLKIGENDEAAWAREWPTYHYIDIGDDGKIGGIVSIDALPPTRDEFEQALAHGSPPVDAYRVGFLPYAILEGYEQVRSDFALWRLAVASEKSAAGRPNAGQAATEIRYRENLTIHDIGLFAHFVGDGSQPLHVSVHFNGWGNFPNPRGFSNDRTTHAEFEGDWVDRYMTAQVITPFFQAPTQLSAVPLPEIERYLKTTDSYVVPFYELKDRGGFVLADGTSEVHREAVRFTAARLAAASQMLDSLILTAWRTSADIRESDS